MEKEVIILLPMFYFSAPIMIVLQRQEAKNEVQENFNFMLATDYVFSQNAASHYDGFTEVTISPTIFKQNKQNEEYLFAHFSFAFLGLRRNSNRIFLLGFHSKFFDRSEH